MLRTGYYYESVVVKANLETALDSTDLEHSGKATRVLLLVPISRSLPYYYLPKKRKPQVILIGIPLTPFDFFSLSCWSA